MKDLEFTNKLYHASLPFGIKLVDNIILLEDGYDAYRENGNMFIIHNSPIYKPYLEIKPNLDKEKKEHGEKKMLEGINKGLLEGEKIGRLEEKIEIVKKLLKNNIDIDIILDTTGFTIEEIEGIKKVWGCNIEYHK